MIVRLVHFIKIDKEVEHHSAVMRNLFLNELKAFHSTIHLRQKEREVMFWNQDVEKVIMMNDYGIRKIF